jgi:SAM-dependent methyltransferase
LSRLGRAGKRTHVAERQSIRAAYDELAKHSRVYNDPESSYATWHMNRRRLGVVLGGLPDAKYGRVLDVGCGYGFLARPLSNRFEMVVGLDVSPVMLSEARKHSGVHLVLADACHMPFKDGLFDCVIALNVFLHLSQPEITVAEMSRVAKRTGSVLIETINQFSPLLFFRKVGYLLGSTPWTNTEWKFFRKRSASAPVKYYSDREMSFLAGKNNLHRESHPIRYLFVGTQFPRGLVIVAQRLEKIIEAAPAIRRLALMSLHVYKKS